MQEEEKTIVRTLYIFMGVALVGSLLVLISALISSSGKFNTFVLAGLVGTITCLAVLWLLRIKQFAIPRLLLPIVVYALATYLIFTGATVGIRDDAILLYALAVAMAGLLLGKIGVVVFGALSVLTVMGAVYGEIQGWLVNSITPQSTTYVTLVTVTITYSLTFAMMYILVDIITSNLKKTRLNQNRLAEANRELNAVRASLETQVQERTAAAEAARAEAEAARCAAETQMWLTAGLAQLAEQMRGDQDTALLADHVIGHLCRYTGAQTGGLFLAQGETLRLMGRYAAAECSDAKTEVEFGAGLVGQVARDKSLILLDEIPPDAPLIASALGESRPRQVLIAALDVDGQVFGVLELATMAEFTPQHQVFIARAAESIAIAFRTVQAHERIASLLVESQRQTEELQSQEEELRAANEELQARAENRSATINRRRLK